MATKTTGECECGNPRPLNTKQCATCAEIEQRHELGDVRDAIAAALAAQAPPASDPPGQQPKTAEALIQRWSHWCRKFGEAAADEDDDGDARMAQEQIWAVEADMLAYPLPASPQAETKGDE